MPWCRSAATDARTAVRGLAAALLGPDSQWRLCAPPGLSPQLVPAAADSFTHVSLSHTRNGVAAAIGPAPIGVDMEPVQRALNWERIARAYFSAVELAQLMRQPPDERRTAFLTLWTCKEAWLKAQGWGLAHLSDAVFAPDGRAGWIAPGSGWQILSWHQPDQWVVSAVWRGRCPLQRWDGGACGALTPAACEPGRRD